MTNSPPPPPLSNNGPILLRNPRLPHPLNAIPKDVLGRPPLSPTGHINVSPKGYEGTFNIVDRKTVRYEDLSGNGAYLDLLQCPGVG
ncbi:uncharacterized protein LACBIDRAFT_315109 [Laccaria bicolor S238N-H82]|uniref:Predicted protein n=1 Tax=Laccaria bicolor (strain S238N-H82 / ATCC MYA-4686) TaxID=486041 RepID=B0DZU5_LACBS|nr:uncharacterized protein LACBIDRAFT_315109 [Laccaria bicolor S238N-H82]EDQ99935.1 predicted protein [Laccaria bicolor S238N-H82]|eukprot:XP_001889478.1 predicted protein [Laccaria bicolor S238N-H82]